MFRGKRRFLSYRGDMESNLRYYLKYWILRRTVGSLTEPGYVENETVLKIARLYRMPCVRPMTGTRFTAALRVHFSNGFGPIIR